MASIANPSPPGQVWLDGEFDMGDDSRLPAWNHGVGVADGVYETFRTYSGFEAARLLTRERLLPNMMRYENGCRLLGLECLMPELLLPICLQAVQANGLDGHDARVRITVWRRGEGEGKSSEDPSSTAVYALPVDQAALEARRTQGLQVVTLTPSRAPGDPCHSIKHMNGLWSVLARRRCRSEGVDDALFLNARGEICEAIWSNVFLLEPDGRTLITPPVDSPCLPGITRQRVMGIAWVAGFDVREEKLQPARLAQAREFFATSSVSEIMPIVGVDGKPIGEGAPGPVAGQLQRLLRASMLS